MILPDFTTPEKLANDIGTVTWDYLRPHYERSALFFVDPGLSLQEVGEAMADNRRDQVEKWLKTGDLVKIGALHAAQWEHPAEVLFEVLVVSPFVLFRHTAS